MTYNARAYLDREVPLRPIIEQVARNYPAAPIYLLNPGSPSPIYRLGTVGDEYGVLWENDNEVMWGSYQVSDGSLTSVFWTSDSGMFIERLERWAVEASTVTSP